MLFVNHDIHVHTMLSACVEDAAAIPTNYIQQAATLGLKTIGFADHVWDRNMPGASPWYQPQDMEHILSIRDQLPNDTLGIKVLIGCESEYWGDGRIGISRAAAEQLDFVLLPMSHAHMTSFAVPGVVTSLADLSQLLVKRFHEVIDLRIATGIAHPFFPIGYIEHVDEIIAGISDTQFIDCFGRAAEAGVSIEIQPSYFPSLHGKPQEGFHDETFFRVLSLAKRCGCYFHFGSDAHSLAALNSLTVLDQVIEQIGINRDDIPPWLR
ncbi:MAG TPA: PHP domain-containing protein [Firmicutes bacterium]|jgi:histidinol phosphatase-like PHP family hydrolase|nr:PHP domain-containing protein [Bacillota bacterium]